MPRFRLPESWNPDADRNVPLGAGLALAVLAMLGVWTGLWVRPEGLRFTVLQLATGVGFAYLYHAGLRLWPALLIGQWLALVSWFGAPLNTLAAAALDTLGVCVGVMLLRRRLGECPPFGSMRNFATYLVLGIGASTVLATVLRLLSFVALQTQLPNPEVLLYWVLGFALGNLLVAPLLFARWYRDAEAPRARRFILPLVLCVALVLLISSDVLPRVWADYLGHLWLPILIWVAWRGELLAASAASLLVALILAAATMRGMGIFAGGDPIFAVVHWQAFVFSFVASALVLAVAAAERRNAEAALRRQQEHLEHDVVARTRTLVMAMHEREQVEHDLRAVAQARQETHERLGESERRYEQLIETLSNGFVLLEPSGRIEFGNRRLAELTGRGLALLAGHRFISLLPRGERKILSQQLERSRNIPETSFELNLRQPSGEVFPVLVSAAGLWHEGRFLGWSLLLFDLRERKAEEAARQDLMRVHRDALVREVHHRIKNNLQGIVGLLRQHLSRAPEHSAALENAIAQVNSVAMVYGLQAREKGQVVRLRGLAESVAEATAHLTGATVELDTGSAGIDAVLSAQEGVPVALVLNELVTNAIKHGMGDKLVRLALHWHDDHVVIGIRNSAVTGSYPPPPGAGGTGLSLVRALLPSQGANLTITAENLGFVDATLRLSAPVVFIEHAHIQQQGESSNVLSSDSRRGR